MTVTFCATFEKQQFPMKNNQYTQKLKLLRDKGHLFAQTRSNVVIN